MNHSLTRFQLLCSLTVAMVIAPITRLLFHLHDVQDDEKVEKQDSKKSKRARMRQWAKGPERAFTEDDPPHRFFFADVRIAARKAVDQLWQSHDGPRNVFGTAVQFWPSNAPKSQMFQLLVEERLLNIAQVKWRLATRFEAPPFNVSWLDRYACLDDVPAENLRQAVNDFLKMDSCCLDPHWALPAQKRVKESEDPHACLFKVAKDFFKHFRPCSLKEEKKHSVQRKIAGGHVSMAASFAQQACQSVIQEVSEIFQNHGGRNLQKATADVVKAAKHARVRKVIHKRPGQMGNPVFFYIARQRAMGCDDKSFAALAQQWKDLSHDSKETWRNLQRCDARRNRQSKQRAAVPETSIKTPWGLGDDTWPLKAEVLKSWLQPFRTKSSGLRELKDRGADGHFPAEQACLDYARKVESGSVKYHSMTAAELGSKATCVAEVTEETQKHVSTTDDIMQVQPHRHHCFSKHPGACQRQHHRELTMISKLIKTLPRSNCVARFEIKGLAAKNRKVVYTKVTVGQVAWNIPNIMGRFG